MTIQVHCWSEPQHTGQFAHLTCPGYLFGQTLAQKPTGSTQTKMSRCDRLPIPGDTAHNCYICQNTPERANTAGLHFTKDCPLLDPSSQRCIAMFFNGILKNRHLVSKEYNIKFAPIIGTLDVGVVEAYYNIQPTSPKPGVIAEDPTPSKPNHRCTRCKPHNTPEYFAFKHFHPEDQPPHFPMDCHMTKPTEVLEMFTVYDKALKHIHQCPSKCSEVPEEVIDMVQAYYGLEPPGYTPVTEPSPLKNEINQKETPIQPKVDVSPCATELSQNTNERRDGLERMDCQSPHTIEPDPTCANSCSDHLELGYASMRWDNDTQSTSCQRTPLLEANENLSRRHQTRQRLWNLDDCQLPSLKTFKLKYFQQ